MKNSSHHRHSLLTKECGKHIMYVFSCEEPIMSEEDQFLNESLGLPTACFPDGFGGDRSSFQ